MCIYLEIRWVQLFANLAGFGKAARMERAARRGVDGAGHVALAKGCVDAGFLFSLAEWQPATPVYMGAWVISKIETVTPFSTI